jgi:hypothetical protein
MHRQEDQLCEIDRAAAEGGEPVPAVFGDQTFHAEVDLVAHGRLDARRRCGSDRTPGGSAPTASEPIPRRRRGTASWSPGRAATISTTRSIAGRSGRSEHEQALGWALFGLPILLVGCAAIGWLIGPRRPIVRGKPIAVAAVLYLASGAWVLLHVVPLL